MKRKKCARFILVICFILNSVFPDAIAAAYLRERESEGLSACTVSRDLPAINKTLGFDLNRGLGLRQRKNSEITRSRTETENDRRRFVKNQDQNHRHESLWVPLCFCYQDHP
jgi:hypothetical protein